ncbi:MAG TPA: peptidoglycan DD-metalloendopeptidase family protein, partial [Ignavibacteria bacterium]
ASFKIGLFLKVLIILLINFSSNSAFSDYIFKDDKNKQIAFYKFDIDDFNKKIVINSLSITDLTKELNSYNQEISKITELLNNIEGTKQDSSFKPFLDEAELTTFSNKLNNLKETFRQRIIWLYKSGMNYGLEVLFTSSTFNDFYIRLEYLQKISQMRKKDFEKIKNFEYIIEEKKKVLNLSKKGKLIYISEKKENQRTLSEKKIIIEKKLSDLNIENETLTRQINIKRYFIDKIENEIISQKSDLILKLNQEIDYKSDDFSTLENKLIYPVNSKYLLIDFDRYFNPSTWTFEYNNGIDLSIARNSDVKCVADGIIENITFIPGYGNVLIVKHSDEYRTIYGVIKDIDVKLQQVVRAGENIAKTSDNLNGQCFHFEIWKNKTPLDPKKWIRG